MNAMGEAHASHRFAFVGQGDMLNFPGLNRRKCRVTSAPNQRI